MESSTNKVMIKVGGSLFDLPDLGRRLREFLKTVTADNVLLFPGGGTAADLVRDWDRRHGLGEEAAHWLALQALTLNAHLLGSLLPGTAVLDWPAPRQHQGLGIVEPYSLARADEDQPAHLPHAWSVTSDSLAVRAAQIMGAKELILLKSVALEERLSWEEAGKRGIVDGYFAQALAKVAGLKVRIVNLRQGE